MFRIKKNYFDGIDEEGNAIILYFAELSIFGIKIPYSSYIFNGLQHSTERSTLQESQYKNSFINNEKLHFSGSWKSIEASISEILFQENKKLLIWNCHTPKAKFNLRLENNCYEGLGYAETLEMNFSPWKLPISELKWGRFLSENHCIIWIEWIGKKPLKKVYWNGNPKENVEISDSGIIFNSENATLKFENPIPIKNEKLQTIVTKYPFLNFFFNAKFLQSEEMKYKTKSILKINKQEEKGFSLYEKVLWKK